MWYQQRTIFKFGNWMWYQQRVILIFGDLMLYHPSLILNKLVCYITKTLDFDRLAQPKKYGEKYETYNFFINLTRVCNLISFSLGSMNQVNPVIDLTSSLFDPLC
jgi:hypothetical protein